MSYICTVTKYIMQTQVNIDIVRNRIAAERKKSSVGQLFARLDYTS